MAAEHDRTRTFELLARAGGADTPAPDRTAALEALAALEDYRAVEPLTAMMLDAELPEPIRTQASDVVVAYQDAVAAEALRTWWGSGDPIVMRHALGLMGRAEADLLIPVAADDAHPLQADALAGMGFGFGEPEFMPVLIRALDHRDRDIRAVAAETLLWEEPVAAEEGLLAAARDRSAELAAVAVNTLRYYPTRRVLRAVAELRDSNERELRAAALETFEDLRAQFESSVHTAGAKEAAAVREWVRPVADLLRPPRPDHPPHPSTPPRPPDVLSEHAVIAILDNPDQDWLELTGTLRRIDWSAYDSGARTRLTGRLATHPDPLVRECAAAVLVGWSDADTLLVLTADPSLSVRKAAMYSLILLPVDPGIATAAWQYLATATGTTAYEALRTYVAHAPAAEAIDRLVELARTDPREVIRHTAIHSLGDLDAADPIRALAPVLHEQPGITWSAHIALLNELGELGSPVRPPAYLATVDNLDLACTLAEYQN
ncbi:hypothetical protein ACFVUS_06805 [Nocardia sp. NPDC058058]|uniref:hypothetical protein n=1 Tax=Nocardia sp. NPDC058058 TaxID=3346317 RepID=UPI0036DD8F44